MGTDFRVFFLPFPLIQTDQYTIEVFIFYIKVSGVDEREKKTWNIIFNKLVKDLQDAKIYTYSRVLHV
jgi:hypothetical protein